MKAIKNSSDLKSRQKIKAFFVSIFIAGLGISIEESIANPRGAEVQSGQLSFSNPNASTLNINQTSDRAIINWNSFSIDSGETTHFIQPSAASVTLNRVTGGDPSKIFGALSANGKIVLVNPNGIWFGPGSVVNVAGLIATTANISNSDFLKGNYRFVQDSNKNVGIVNEGTISVADHGLAALVAPGVENRGVIKANLGKVALGSGTEFTVVDTYGDGLVTFAANSQTAKKVLRPDGTVMNNAVANHGAIYADGGTVLITAKVAKNVVDNVVNMDGVVQADSIAERNGEIILSGGDTGIVKTSGKIYTRGTQRNTKAGIVKITGENVGLFAGTDIDVSGKAGGGTVLVGGDKKGSSNNAKTASHTKAVYVDAKATVKANALENGDGGKVVFWSDDYTNFHGDIEAKGGALGGNGGFIDASSKKNLNIGDDAKISTTAIVPNFKHGIWSLDHANLTIGSDTDEAGASSHFQPAKADAKLSAAALMNALNTTDVVVSTGNDDAGQGGDITIDANINWSTNKSLAINAYGSLKLNSNKSISNTGTGNLNLNANNSINLASGSNISLGTAATGKSGELNINAKNGLTINGTINTYNAMLLNAGDGNLALDGANIVSNNNKMVLQGATANLTNNFFFNSGSGLFVIKATGNSKTQPSLGLGDGANGLFQVSSALLNNVMYNNSATSFIAANGITANGIKINVVQSTGKSFPIMFDAGQKGTLKFINTTIDTRDGGAGNNDLTLQAKNLTIDNASKFLIGGDVYFESYGSIGLGNINNKNISSKDFVLSNNQLNQFTAKNLKFYTGIPNSTHNNTDIAVAGMMQPGAVTEGIYLNSYNGSINFLTDPTESTFNSITGIAGKNIGIANNINSTGNIKFVANSSAVDNSNLGLNNSDQPPLQFKASSGGLTLNKNITLNSSGNVWLETSGLANNAIGSPANNLLISGNINANQVILKGNNLVSLQGGVINAKGSVTVYANYDGDRALYFVMDSAAHINSPGLVTVNVNNTQPPYGNAGSLGVPVGFAQLGNITAGDLVVNTAYGTGNTTGGYIIQTANTALNIKNTAAFTTGGGGINQHNGAVVDARIVLDQSGNFFGGNVSLNTGKATSGVPNNAKINYSGNNKLQVAASNIQGGDLTIISNKSDLQLNGIISAKDNVNLVTNGVFNNTAGNHAILVANGSRFLVWSNDPSKDDRGGLAYDFKQYNAIYGSANVAQSTGNGFLYQYAPEITATLTGSTSKTYDGNQAAILNASNFNFTGAIDGDTLTINTPSSGTLNDKNVGNNKLVTASDIAIADAKNGNAKVYEYKLHNSIARGDIGNVDRQNIVLSAGTDTKTYDGTINSNKIVSTAGLVSGDSISNLTQSFASKNVLGTNGSTLKINNDYTINDGNGGKNYSVTLNSAKGTIIPADLLIEANGDSKTYTGLPYSGFVNNETPAILSSRLIYGGNSQGVVNAEIYRIKPSGLISGNYEIIYVNGTLEIHVDTESVTPQLRPNNIDRIVNIYILNQLCANNGFQCKNNPGFDQI